MCTFDLQAIRSQISSAISAKALPIVLAEFEVISELSTIDFRMGGPLVFHLYGHPMTLEC